MYITWDLVGIRENTQVFKLVILSKEQKYSSIFTCHMKNRLETQTTPAYFHWAFAFHTVAQHLYASPVLCSKLSVIVCIKSWPLLKSKFQLQLFFIIKFMNKNGGHLIKDMDCCSSWTHENFSNSVKSDCCRGFLLCQKKNISETAKSLWKSENFMNWYKLWQLLHPEFTTLRTLWRELTLPCCII